MTGGVGVSVAIGSRAQNSLELKDVTPAYPTAPLLIITTVFEEKVQSDCHLNFLCEYKVFKE